MESRSSRVNGTKIHYLLGGSEEDQVVVLLHGLGMSPSLYEPLGEILLSKHLVIIPDYSGLGEASFADIAKALAKKFGRDDLKLTLVAHSMGGGVAISWVKLFPKTVSKVILVGSCGEFVQRSLIGWGIAAVYKALRSWRHPKTVLKIAVSFSWNWLKHPIWMWQAFRLTTTCDLVLELTDISAEIKLIWADHDEYFPSCERMETMLGIEAQVIDQVGHDWIILEPKAAAKEIERLL